MSDPSVGIFWRVGGVLVTDRSTLAEAEPYGDCLTHAAGHYERWEQWRKLGATRLAALGLPAQIASTEYDEWPRGRIVYEKPARRFVLYADRRLQTPDVIAAVRSAFGLDNSEAIVRSDAHYRRARPALILTHGDPSRLPRRGRCVIASREARDQETGPDVPWIARVARDDGRLRAHVQF